MKFTRITWFLSLPYSKIYFSLKGWLLQQGHLPSSRQGVTLMTLVHFVLGVCDYDCDDFLRVVWNTEVWTRIFSSLLTWIKKKKKRIDLSFSICIPFLITLFLFLIRFHCFEGEENILCCPKPYTKPGENTYSASAQCLRRGLASPP